MPGADLSFNTQWEGSPSFCPLYKVSFNISPETGDILIYVDAPFHNDVPPSRKAGKLENLYEHEVVEIFLSSVFDDRKNCPYLEIQIGPHGHYMLVFFMKEGDWEGQDQSLELDHDPKCWIDYQTMRWYCEMSIPAHFLPQPRCGDDLSVTWNCNAFACYGVEEKRRCLACYSITNEVFNFHQLQFFQLLTLFETSEMREILDRDEVSIFHKKMQHLNLLSDDMGSKPTSKTLSVAASADEYENKEEFGGAALVSVEDVAKSLREKFASLAKGPAMHNLEEKYMRHIQQDHGEFPVLFSKVWKRKGLSFKNRMLILTSKPRLFYLDGQGNVRGSITWTMAQRISAKKVDKSKFEVSMPEGGRIYHLYDSTWGADMWVDTIMEIVNTQRDYMRKSRKI